MQSVYEYLQSQGHEYIHLFGTSMGAVAIMKAVSDHGVPPTSIILECPFGQMYKTVCARFDRMGVPQFPMAGLLTLWGGALNGFWSFGHNPEEYAHKISCPTLLMYGTKDKNVSREEIDIIFGNLDGTKELKIYPDAGHENYLIKYEAEWTEGVSKLKTQPFTLD